MARDTTAAAGLEAYRAKRDPRRTPEPVPPPGPLPQGNDDTFVIQEHHATALHWDVRLERDGVLVSWAVPKGLPLDPAAKHLAVHTEDHPLDYASFEGEIPAGEYGGGQVILWDRGRYQTVRWTDDRVEVVFDGERASGRYLFFRTGKRDRDWMVRRLDAREPDWAPLPELLRPMMAVARPELPADESAYGYEFKWDGVRAVVYVEGGRPRVLSRNDRDVTGSYPELRALAEALGSRQVVLDGEIVTFGPDGRPSFAALQQRMHVTSASAVRRLVSDVPVTFLAFDVLHLDGHPTLDLPYRERRELLDSLELSGPRWQTPPWFPGDGSAVLAASQQQGLEGVVAKRLDSRYSPGKRSDCWLKIKHRRMQEVVVGGWKPGQGRRTGVIGSLLLGVHDDDGQLVYAGHVGTGFSERDLRRLSQQLADLETDASPFDGAVPREHARDAHWVRPELVGEVVFAEWTRDGRLRHPSWRGLRPDKDPQEVTREP